MNPVTIQERKERIIKTLALFGLFAVIIFSAWLSVKIVTTLPSAITSLASLAETVYQYNPKAETAVNLIYTPEHLTTGIATTLRWEKPFDNGSYSFSYACGKDIFLQITSKESNFTGMDCETNYDLGNVDSASLLVHKDSTPDTDLNYTIYYFKTNKTTSSASTTASVGIIKGSEISISPSTNVEVTVENDKPIITSTPVIKPITIPQPEPEYTYVYKIPVSNPEGSTDLAIKYLGIGTTDTNGNFVSTGSLKQNQSGSIQFSVQNIGTKTSKPWSFSAILPGNIAYTSKIQTPLKPNEKATLTISFTAIEDISNQKFTFELIATDDINKKNNQISWSTAVVK